MKKLLLLAATSLLFTTYAQAEWINPDRKACTKNGGKLAPGGICEATWHDAKRICAAADARLPTIKKLRYVVTACGGEIDDEANNVNDPSYQSCYKRKGFSSSSYYWSSTTSVGYTRRAWVVYFNDGSAHDNHKGNNGYVRCVRDGQ